MTRVSSIIDDKSGPLFNMLKDIEGMEVFVGIPETKTSRKRGGSESINNAQLMYIHTHGSPRAQIPPRPVIEPAITEKTNRAQIVEELGDSVKALLDGQRPKAKTHMRRAGMAGQNAARGWFDNSKNNWPPNTPLTIARKGSEKPLIDTAQLRKSITYVVRG